MSPSRQSGAMPFLASCQQTLGHVLHERIPHQTLANLASSPGLGLGVLRP